MFTGKTSSKQSGGTISTSRQQELHVAPSTTDSENSSNSAMIALLLFYKNNSL